MEPTAATLQSRMLEADHALASGNPEAARSLLEQLASEQPADIDFWRRLASLRRRAGEPLAALQAIDSALALAPLDFVSLLFKAGCLDQAGSPEAGEAYGRALAQAPLDPPPTALQPAVSRAESQYRAHQAELELRLAGVLAGDSEVDDDPRIARFVSNISRRTRPYHSEPTHYHFPGLRELEFHDRAAFPWLTQWEASTDMIAAEFSDLLAAESAELVPYVQYGTGEPLAQWQALNHSRDWTAIHLVKQGHVVSANAGHCPKTMDLLAQFPQPRIAGCGPNAMFSLLAPQTRIPPHTGVANFRLVCHLPLQVPPGCWFRVGAQTREWRRGEAFVFDDTLEHEAANTSDSLRVVMIIDCWHPDLGEAERKAISAIVGAASSQGLGL